MKLKLLTFNIHKGLNWKNNKLTVNSLKLALKKLNPDIVFLQEIVGENKKLEKKMSDWVPNQIEYLTEGIWQDSVYSHHALFNNKNHGNAILSKYPIKSFEVENITLNPLEKRAILFTEIELPHVNIHCYCTHLNLLHRDRVRQYRFISEYIRKKTPKETPIAFAGDFNDWNQKASTNLFDIPDFHDAYKVIHDHYAKTFPSFYPFFKLDRIYTKGINIKEAKVLSTRPWNGLSDHLPILIHADL